MSKQNAGNISQMQEVMGANIDIERSSKAMNSTFKKLIEYWIPL